MQENVRTSVHKLSIKRTWVTQQGADPKHKSRSTKDPLQKNKGIVQEWPGQSTDLNPIGMLWKDMK